MKIFRRYCCDFSHEWVVHVEESSEETEADCHCPEGHEAVTCRPEIPVDLVRLTICPATRMIGPGPRQDVTGEGMFYVSISDREDRLLRTSTQIYTFRNAVNLIERFTSKTAAEACAYWDHVKP